MSFTAFCDNSTIDELGNKHIALFRKHFGTGKILHFLAFLKIEHSVTISDSPTGPGIGLLHWTNFAGAFFYNTCMKRDKHGRFAKGNKGGPGRPRQPDSSLEENVLMPCGRLDPRATALSCFDVGACFLGSGGAMREQTNASALECLQELFKQACFETLIPGFFGAVVITIPIQDGTIQEGRNVSIRENRRGPLHGKNNRK